MGNDKKWIYLSYIAGILLLSWVLDQSLRLALNPGAAFLTWVTNEALKTGMGTFRAKNPMVLGVLPATSLISFAAVSTYAYLYLRRPKVQAFSTEVMQELRKVTWPTKKNTYLSTVVVIVSVVVMAVILGFFDWVCTRLVGLVLQA